MSVIAPVSVRLDDDVREVLEEEARHRHIGLSTYLRQIASEAAERARRDRIRLQSAVVGAYVSGSPQARGFYEDWGGFPTPPERD